MADGGDCQKNKTCPKCFKELPNILFASHIKSTHYFCNTCLRWFSTLKSLVDHTSNCNKESAITKVNKENTDEKNEAITITNKEEDKCLNDQDLLPVKSNYQCEFCKKSFKNLYFLKKHGIQENHQVKSKKYLCSSCKVSLNSLQSLREHSINCKVPTQEEFVKLDKYICTICKCWFSTLESQKEHSINCSIKENTNSLISKWNEIKSIKDSEILVNNENTKNDQDHDVSSYHCESCNKSFKDFDVLKKHIVQENHKVKLKKQEVNKQLACASCKVSFKSLQILREHSISCKAYSEYISTHNALPNQNKYICTFCNCWFSTLDSQKEHSINCSKKEDNTTNEILLENTNENIGGKSKDNSNNHQSSQESPVTISPAKLSPETISPVKLSPVTISPVKLTPGKFKKYLCATCKCWFSTEKSQKEHTINCKKEVKSWTVE